MKQPYSFYKRKYSQHKRNQLEKKPTLKNSLIGWLEKAITLGGSIAAVYFAIISINLQTQSNQLAADNSMQQQQIDTLTTMLKEIRTQNVISQDQNTRLENISKEAIVQSKLTNNQLNATNSILNVNSELAKGQKKQELEKFLQSYWKLTKLFPANHHDLFKELDTKAKSEHLKKAVQILDNELINLHLYTDDSLYKKWVELGIQAKICLHNIQTDKVFNLNTNTWDSDEERIESINGWFKSYQKVFQKLENYVMKKYIVVGDRGWWDRLYQD